MQGKYLISPETFFDADMELYFTYILHNNSEKTFAFTAFGSSENESKEAARYLVLYLDIN